MKRMALVLRSPSGLAGSILVFLMFAVALLSVFWTPHDPLAISLGDRFAPPGSSRWLGGDEFGRDVLSRLMTGFTSSAMIAIFSVLIALLIGVTLGLLSGYFGGATDRLITILNDALLAFPGILFAMGFLAVLGPSRWGVTVALGLAFAPTAARVVRTAALSVRTRGFVEASRVSGNSDTETILRHILPNVAAPVIILGASMLGWAILAESALSFLGLGVPPPTPTWGAMLAEARPFISYAPWLIIAPGCCIAAALLGINLLGDGLRDALDPRMRELPK